MALDLTLARTVHIRAHGFVAPDAEKIVLVIAIYELWLAVTRSPPTQEENRLRISAINTTRVQPSHYLSGLMFLQRN